MLGWPLREKGGSLAGEGGRVALRKSPKRAAVATYLVIHTHIYIYIHTYAYVYIYIYIFIYL